MIAAWRRRRLIAGLVMAALLIAAGSYALAAPRYSRALTTIPVVATPIASFDNRDPTRVRFGALEFRGGLVLTSSYAPFGGIEPDVQPFLERHRQWLLAARAHRL